MAHTTDSDAAHAYDAAVPLSYWRQEVMSKTHVARIRLKTQESKERATLINQIADEIVHILPVLCIDEDKNNTHPWEYIASHLDPVVTDLIVTHVTRLQNQLVNDQQNRNRSERRELSDTCETLRWSFDRLHSAYNRYGRSYPSKLFMDGTSGTDEMKVFVGGAISQARKAFVQFALASMQYVTMLQACDTAVGHVINNSLHAVACFMATIATLMF